MSWKPFGTAVSLTQYLLPVGSVTWAEPWLFVVSVATSWPVRGSSMRTWNVVPATGAPVLASDLVTVRTAGPGVGVGDAVGGTAALSSTTAAGEATTASATRRHGPAAPLPHRGSGIPFSPTTGQCARPSAQFSRAAGPCARSPPAAWAR